jgi:Ca2+-binding EF-hand superfamily protein
LDANNDGFVSAEEFENRPDRFALADADGNGLLTAEELMAAGQERAERRVARMIERLDANGDGALSQEEIADRRSPERMFTRLDANEDGMVSKEEFAEARMGHHGFGKRHGNR